MPRHVHWHKSLIAVDLLSPDLKISVPSKAKQTDDEDEDEDEDDGEDEDIEVMAGGGEGGRRTAGDTAWGKRYRYRAGKRTTHQCVNGFAGCMYPCIDHALTIEVEPP
ncbi:hypothetical protein TEQG_04537 [Trichophyton equinum CBS 127.97]|uniref:Uncharacterized protein n=1 Tax=Trichophyton equinum (strain ATCC MYA-4606 / CBS 127.97) TaxID=559882 RepID=F2PUG0_TRIEC|nr:hypothetical protein TEQG_04537 [Trichophyton equinum CBS 127.97]